MKSKASPGVSVRASTKITSFHLSSMPSAHTALPHHEEGGSMVPVTQMATDCARFIPCLKASSGSCQDQNAKVPRLPIHSCPNCWCVAHVSFGPFLLPWSSRKLLIHALAGVTLRNITLGKGQVRKVRTVKSHLCEILQQAKLIYGERNHNSGCLGVRDWLGREKRNFLRQWKYSLSWQRCRL